jgi:tetratricopeptide (TPR) repeat protein
MQAFVFTDEALREQAGRFVWLDIDMDKPQNVAFRDKFEVRGLPTYFVLEPRTEQVLLKWVGGATVAQLGELLDDARASFQRVRAGEAPGTGGGADDLLAEADLLYGQGQGEEAVRKYEEAIAAAPADWSAYGRAVQGLATALLIADENARLVELAEDALPRLRGTTEGAIVVGLGLDGAVSLPEDDPAKEEALALFEPAVEAVVADASLDIADDDRSGLYISLLNAREAAGDSTAEHATLERWSAFLDEAAARAATPAGRTVFDSHRTSAYLALGKPEAAIEMLQQSERDLPEDYNPPSRLSRVYRSMERWDDALAATNRAIERAYGPRVPGLMLTRADLQVTLGDSTAARATLNEALERVDALPEAQRSERTVEGIRRRLEALGE